METFRTGSLSTVALEPTGYTEVAPFLGLTERATDRIVFTDSDEFAEDVKNRDAMPTVRGIDFDDLTGDDFRAISCWLRWSRHNSWGRDFSYLCVDDYRFPLSADGIQCGANGTFFKSHGFEEVLRAQNGAYLLVSQSFLCFGRAALGVQARKTVIAETPPSAANNEPRNRI